jgi:aminoglycoside phosphotransferase family enzyme/predicted kinase
MHPARGIASEPPEPLDAALARQAALVDALARTLRANGRRVQRFETHVSWVIVADDEAWKLKKAVRPAFLDFGTLARRHRACEAELRVNRPFAPQLYLGVVPIAGVPRHPVAGAAGPVLEWALHMRAFPQEARWDRLVRHGELRRDHVDALARRLAALHAQAPVAGAGRPRVPVDPVGHALAQQRATLDALASLLCDADDRARLARLAQRLRARAPWRAAVGAERLVAGRYRECHGDLHLANLLWLDGQPVLFDAIEFDPGLRWIDTIADLAFASMDLGRHGRADLGRRLVDVYLAESGDYDGTRVLLDCEADRALVRALVAAMREIGRDRRGGAAAGRGGAARAPWRPYLATALAATEPRQPVLFITHGFSGSGKSTRAEGLVEAVGAIRIRADVERKRLHGLAPTAVSRSDERAGLYGAQATQATYARLYALAVPVLRGGCDAVLDATFLQRAERDRARSVAVRLGVSLVILDFPVSRRRLRARVAARAARVGEVSEAGPAVLEAQFAAAQALAADEVQAVVRVTAAGRRADPGRGSPRLWRRLRAAVR